MKKLLANILALAVFFGLFYGLYILNSLGFTF